MPDNGACNKTHAKHRGSRTEGVRYSTVDVLVKIACFVKEKKIFFIFKSRLLELVGTRRSTVLILALH